MAVRVERAGPAVPQLDDLDAGDVLADDAAVPAPRVQLALPGEQDAVAEAVLQRLELGGELGMQQRGDAVGLRVIDRPVEHEVGIRAQPLPAALLPRDRIMPGQPYPQATRGELVCRDGPVLDDEPIDVGSGCCAIRFERVSARRVAEVSVAGAVERVGDGLSDSAGFDTPLPPLEPPRMAPG